MTIPTLITQNQQKGWDTGSTVFERKLAEAMKVMNTQQTLAGYTTTTDFVNELLTIIFLIKCNFSDINKKVGIIPDFLFIML